MSRQFQDACNQLIDTLRAKGIVNENVLRAMQQVPRERFVSGPFKQRAYEDVALPIDKHQTISQPFTVARMTELLEPKPGDAILEIGTGSGYQAAILAEMGAKVYTIERHFELYNAARTILKELYPIAQIQCRFGDGTIGWSEFAPYQGIIVTAGAPEIPEALLKQLAIGGHCIIPVGNERSQVMHCIILEDEQSFSDYPIEDVSFVPLIGKQGWNGES
ncbi:MAG: protein-L-isoaspartate(D-aspartate) O-methyltransferase [Candidatus Kapaibacteriota bacterium]